MEGSQFCFYMKFLTLVRKQEKLEVNTSIEIKKKIRNHRKNLIKVMNKKFPFIYIWQFVYWFNMINYR